jgi:4-hydroxy-tetrahydrodipicolinate synthase
MDRPLEGVYPYLVSPVDPAGRVKEAVLARLVDHLVERGVHGLAPLGSTGEVAYLDWEQRRRIVQVVLEAARGRVPVVAGVESASTAAAVAQAQAFEAMGADGVVVILTSYFPLGEAQVAEHLRTVAAAVSCPVVLYANPRFTGVDLSLAVLERLAELPNVRYYKDATGDTGKLLTLVNRLGDRLRLFSASAHVPLFVFMLGGVGWMGGPACLIPEQSVRLYELARAGRWDEALALQRRLWALNAAFQRYSLAGCIKAGLEMQGFDVGGTLPPQPPLGPEARAEIAATLRDLGAL